MAARNSEKDKRMAAELKRQGDERRTGVCPICYTVHHGDMLKAGMAAHKCWFNREDKK